MIRAAVPTENGNVSGHFGRCPEYTIVDIDGDRVVSKEIVPNPGHEPGRIPQFLHDQGVHLVAAGGMGMRANDLFAQMGIETILGVSGPVDEVIEGLRAGSLESAGGPCDHHQGGCD
ncbi:MAG: NifB/NifX family molybdenum-iron cluster-binding protein [Spirochaetia bacterium]